MEIAKINSKVVEFKDNAVQDIFQQTVDVEVCQNIASLISANISELTENLILCSASCVNQNVLDTLNISCIVNVAPELPELPLFDSDLIYHKISVVDSGYSRIYSHFDETADLIHKVASSGGRTLVYCVAGVSRSATICLAYLMKHQGLTLLEAYNYVKLRRPKIKPNCGFFKQLIEYEKRLSGNNTVHMIFNEFVQMEIPDVYDCEYRFVSQFSKNRRIKAGRR